MRRENETDVAVGWRRVGVELITHWSKSQGVNFLPKHTNENTFLMFQMELITTVGYASFEPKEPVGLHPANSRL